MIAVTGSIGSGKSSVARLLSAETDSVLLDMDQIAAEILTFPSSALTQLQAVTGNEFFSAAGHLDRPAFRKALFAQPALREQVNALLHPMLLRVLQEKNRAYQNNKKQSVLVEVPLLFEAGWQDTFSCVVTVYAGRGECVQRIIDRDGCSLGEAQQALATQQPSLCKALRSDHVIDNSSAWWDTVLQIKRLGRLLSRKKT